MSTPGEPSESRVATAHTSDAAREFTRAADPLRGELMAHCYRMLGSLQDAEDQVQETYLRAWRAFHAFEGRSTVRTWMHTIATRACLTALEQRARRSLPSDLGQASSDPLGELEARPEIPWLEPLPDARVGEGAANPLGASLARESLRLAFVAALQSLTPQQRAVLVLRDVLAFSAEETAQALEVSVASANSSLQRARAGLERRRAARTSTNSDSERLREHERELLERYMRAFEAYDTNAVLELLREDATWEMPPFTGWYAGAEAIGALIRTHCPARGPADMRFVATRANGQPATAAYLRDEAGVYRAFQIHVLELVERPDGVVCVAHVSCFFDLALFAAFDLPDALSS